MAEEDILSGNLEPTNEGYALAKIVSAKAIESVVLQDGLKWRILIPSNLYGPRDNFDLATCHLVPAIINKVWFAVQNNLDSVEIWGSGLARREFTYVQDVAEFLVENLSNIENWETIMNIGYGKDYSINEYYEIVGKLLGYSGRFVNLNDKPEGMKLKLMDSTKATQHGWKPKFDLEKGLERTIEWYQSQIQK
jgi:GDP-L-fucose synthase